jgi:hypothetical protein
LKWMDLVCVYVLILILVFAISERSLSSCCLQGLFNASQMVLCSIWYSAQVWKSNGDTEDHYSQ